MAFINPLDLEYILINTFAGSYYIFLFFMMIVIGALAARFKMPNFIALTMFVLFALIIDNENTSGLYVFSVIFTGLVSFYAISRIVKN